MEKLIAYGLKNNVFSTRAIARMVYGNVHLKEYWNSRHDELTKVIAWELPNIKLIPKKERQKLYQELMHDRCNQDFFAVRALCALGYQQFSQETIDDSTRHTFYWNTHYEMLDIIRQGHNIMALKEVRLWHQWGLPYAMEEVIVLQHIIGQNIEYMQEFRDWMTAEHLDALNNILAFEKDTVKTDNGYELLQKLPMDIVYEFLIKIYGDTVR